MGKFNSFKKLQYLIVLCALLVGGSRVIAADSPSTINGLWTGVYTVSDLRQGAVFQLYLVQTGSQINGVYWTSTGVSGVGLGTISGDTAEIYWQNNSPNCPGNYRNEYVFDGNTMTFSYSGWDCLGSESGSGKGQRIEVTAP